MRKRIKDFIAGIANKWVILLVLLDNMRVLKEPKGLVAMALYLKIRSVNKNELFYYFRLKESIL